MTMPEETMEMDETTSPSKCNACPRGGSCDRSKDGTCKLYDNGHHCKMGKTKCEGCWKHSGLYYYTSKECTDSEGSGTKVSPEKERLGGHPCFHDYMRYCSKHC